MNENSVLQMFAEYLFRILKTGKVMSNLVWNHCICISLLKWRNNRLVHSISMLNVRERHLRKFVEMRKQPTHSFHVYDGWQSNVLQHTPGLRRREAGERTSHRGAPGPVGFDDRSTEDDRTVGRPVPGRSDEAQGGPVQTEVGWS